MATLIETAKATGENLCNLLAAMAERIEQLNEENIQLKQELEKFKNATN
jgi:hypothetical protein